MHLSVNISKVTPPTMFIVVLYSFPFYLQNSWSWPLNIHSSTLPTFIRHILPIDLSKRENSFHVFINYWSQRYPSDTPDIKAMLRSFFSSCGQRHAPAALQDHWCHTIHHLLLSGAEGAGPPVGGAAAAHPWTAFMPSCAFGGVPGGGFN